MSLASALLFALVTVLLLLDLFTLWGRARRILVLETLAFVAALLLIVRQDWAMYIARQVGLWRGVDVVIYPLTVWLFREALLSRHARWVEGRRLERLVRSLAIRQARVSEERAEAPR